MSKRILHISTRLILGGSQENTVLSCEGQVKRGHEVHLAYGPIFGPEGSLLERVNSFSATETDNPVSHPCPINTHILPDMIRELNPYRDYRANKQCRKLIRDLKPDIVHTHSSKAGILGRAAAWAEGGKHGQLGVVHTIHGLPYHPYQSKWLNKLYILSERWAAKRCHKIVTVCDAMTRQSRAAGVGVDNQYVTVYSGMEIERFVEPGITRDEIRNKLGIKLGDFVIGTISRLAELKGHDDLLDSLSETMKSHPEWKLLWIGDGWWRERLLGKANKMGLRNQIITTGLVPPEDVPGYIPAMDILVHPSYREGLPRTVPQALLGRVPVISYELDGAPEVCIHEKTGLLVKPGDHDGLREAVHWMYEHINERQKMALAGQELCIKRFSAHTMVNRLDEVYDEVLNSLK